MAETSRNCELCSDKATLYCPSDSAFLCSSCDAKVHNANFLVARHVRSSICPSCRNLDGNLISGVNISPPATRHPCRNCSPEEFQNAGEIEIDIDDSHSSSSSCVSSTTEPGEEVVSVSSSSRKTRRERISGGVVAPVVVDRRVEGVLVNWCRRLGVDDKRSREVVAMAVDLAGGCLSRMTILPFRVSLAAALWVALRLCGGGDGSRTCQELRKVEQISGVPAKLILATEARLARVIKHRRSRENHEEGWAEC